MERLVLSKLDRIPNGKYDWTKSASLYKNAVNRRYTKLTKSEMSELVNKAAKSSGEEKRGFIGEILDAMGPLIMRLSLQFSDTDNYMDYVQEAAITVMDCVDKFDTRHNSNSSFVTYCITAVVARFDLKGKEFGAAVRNTSATPSEIMAVKSYYEKYVRDNYMEPSEEELRDFCKKKGITYCDGIEHDWVCDSIDDTSFLGPTEVPGTMLDVDAAVDNTDMSPDTWSSSYDAKKMLEILREKYLLRAKRKRKYGDEDYTARDLDILFEHYGIGVDQPMSVFELSMKYHTTETRIQQIIKRTPAMIRECVSAQEL